MTATQESIKVSANLLSQMFLYLESLKVDVDLFLRSAGVEPSTVKSFDFYIPIETYLHIQDEAAIYVNDSCFGLHMGEFAEVGSWSILGYMMMNCKNLGEAFEKSERYSRIIGNFIQARAEPHGDKIKIIFSTPLLKVSMSRHCFDASLSSGIRLMRSLVGVNINPLEVSFTCAAPASMSEYERVFQSPVSFGQKENSFTIDSSLLNMPIPMANPGLLEYFERYGENFLAEMDRKDEHTQTVTRIILTHLDDEGLSINKVAREMAVSVRTLQNRLEEEGVAFSDLLRDVRQRLAKQYLRENYTVEQITYMLGFSEPSVFRKAFKKWSGVTPREYRENTGLASA
jgi:AraC-like DNA-binding protein